MCHPILFVQYNKKLLLNEGMRRKSEPVKNINFVLLEVVCLVCDHWNIAVKNILQLNKSNLCFNNDSPILDPLK